MGDVISSHLDEAKREIITAHTGKLMGEFGCLYEQQYAVALFNKVRFDIEGGGGPQPQLLHRKIPLENKSIFSGSMFQYQEENKKWRNHFFFVPDSYNMSYYDNKAAYDKHLHPKGTVNCAGYKVLTSLEQYLDLISNSLPTVKAKVGSSPFLKCPNQFPLILWHPYARHYYFCVVTEKEQQKWYAVLQDCVRHSNDGLCEEDKVQTPAFTDSVRLYRQAQGDYGTWEMMCGVPSQILSNLVMEGLLPELRALISPRLKGKLHERQRNWMLISGAVYSLVQGQCQAQYEAVLHMCEAARSSLEASIRTDMDQIITSKEHVTNKIRAVVLPKAEKLLKVSIQPYISSILDALMEPTSRGFSEVRDVFFRELVDMSKNTLNNDTKETMAQHMEVISMLAFHPVKMQRCFEMVEQLNLEGLQQRFDVSSPSVFVQRAQILMRKQMDNAVYTFEQILHQNLESQGTEALCKTIQRCQDRVIKKFDYDSSTVRKRFFREALLQIFIPYMLKQLSPTCAAELPRFQELIFEDFSRFILVDNIFEEVVLHSAMKDIMMAVKEAAVQRRHNLYRDSIVLGNSDPSLHLLGENPSIDWAGEYRGAKDEAEGPGEDTEGDGEGGHAECQKRRRMKQVVSMIQEEGSPEPSESSLEVPGISVILEEVTRDGEEHSENGTSSDKNRSTSAKMSEKPSDMLNGSTLKEEGAKSQEQRRNDVKSAAEDASVVSVKDKGENNQSVVEEEPTSNPEEVEEELSPQSLLKKTSSDASETTPENMSNGSILEEEKPTPEEECEEDVSLRAEPATEEASATEEEVTGEKCQPVAGNEPPSNHKPSEETSSPPLPEEMLSKPMEQTSENAPKSTPDFSLPPHDDSGFQSPTSEEMEELSSCASQPQPTEKHPVAQQASVAATPESEPQNQ
ncbi:protein Niban 2b [Odontesthes bonariensis]|uniref:protein Niban 2-like n=1 Tax=Odontesthes bonariensis TaxID=219752 RepID=UPI003F580FE2